MYLGRDQIQVSAPGTQKMTQTKLSYRNLQVRVGATVTTGLLVTNPISPNKPKLKLKVISLKRDIRFPYTVNQDPYKP